MFCVPDVADTVPSSSVQPADVLAAVESAAKKQWRTPRETTSATARTGAFSDVAHASDHLKRTSKYPWRCAELTEPCKVPMTQRFTSENTLCVAGSTTWAGWPDAAIEVPWCS